MLTGGQATLGAGSLGPVVGFGGAVAAFLPSAVGVGAANQQLLFQAIVGALSGAWGAWASGYAVQLVVVGGVAAWVPGPPPAPGPWSGGTNVPQVLEAGSSTGDSQMSPTALAGVVLASLPPAIAFNGPTAGMISFVNAITKGFGNTWALWKASTKISGGLGSGTAAPLGAITVGTLAGAKLL